MYYEHSIKEMPEDAPVLAIIQYLTELPIETCRKVRDDLYAFYEHLSHKEVDDLLRKHWKDREIGIICQVGVIGGKYGARSLWEIALTRRQNTPAREEDDEEESNLEDDYAKGQADARLEIAGWEADDGDDHDLEEWGLALEELSLDAFRYKLEGTKRAATQGAYLEGYVSAHAKWARLK
jgi:hypothetical protein